MSPESTIAVIAAGSALAGVLLSQFISIGLSVFDKRHQKNILLRQKYEEMMFLFQDSLSYVQAVYNCDSFSQLCQLSSAPGTNKALGLASLYFPSLVEPLSMYSDSQLSFYHSVISLYDESKPANAGAQVVANSDHKKLLETLSNTQQLATDTIIQNAKKYTKA